MSTTMSPAVWLCAALCLSLPMCLMAMLAWVRLWRRALAVPDAFDALTELRSPDGALIRVGRIFPAGEPSSLPPVLMCHGLAMNRLALALDRESSLAGALSRAGRDVWLLELRGAGREGFDPRHADSSFDTYAEMDVPTALAHVLAETGARELDWVGFSMGGMLAYAHLGALQGGKIRRLVTLGSPMSLRQPRVRGLPGLVSRYYLHFLARTPFEFASSLVAPLMGPWVPWVLTPGLRPGHYSPSRLRAVLSNVMADAPRGVTRQFVRWMASDEIDSNDGARGYLKALSGVKVPARIIAGSKDRLAPERSVRVAFDAFGSPEKDFVVIGKASASPEDFDHLDLILGGHAREHVFPRVIEWLSRGG